MQINAWLLLFETANAYAKLWLNRMHAMDEWMDGRSKVQLSLSLSLELNYKCSAYEWWHEMFANTQVARG